MNDYYFKLLPIIDSEDNKFPRVCKVNPYNSKGAAPLTLEDQSILSRQLRALPLMVALINRIHYPPVPQDDNTFLSELHKTVNKVYDMLYPNEEKIKGLMQERNKQVEKQRNAQSAIENIDRQIQELKEE